MSTRSMTVLTLPGCGDEKALPLYRHWDGYPAVAGMALADALDGARDMEEVVVRLLGDREEYEGKDRGPNYRLATYQPERQGDLEHVYHVRWVRHDGTRPAPPTAAFQVTHHHRDGWDDGSDDYRNWPSTTYTLEEFREFVASEWSEMEQRAAARGIALV